LFTEYNFTAYPVRSITEGWRKITEIKQQGSPLDIIVCDNTLVEGDNAGIIFARELRVELYIIPFVLISARVPPGISRLIEQGIVQVCWQKNDRWRELMIIVEKLLTK
jgi:CheY-like chemotaxis protein